MIFKQDKAVNRATGTSLARMGLQKNGSEPEKATSMSWLQYAY